MVNPIDRYIFLFINKGLQNKVLDVLFTYISILGEYKYIIIIVGILFSIGTVSLKKTSLIGFLILHISSWMVYFLKGLFMRPRPFEILEGVRLLNQGASGPSFPSGHTTKAFAICYLLAWRYPRFARPLFITAAFIGLSRIYMGLHFLSDVLAGVLLGIAISFVVITLYKKTEGEAEV